MARVPADGLTRRAILRGAAVAGAAALVHPPVGVARGGTVAGVFSVSVGALAAGRPATVPAPRSFSLVGIEWREPIGARIELRTRDAAARGLWSPWVSASVRGHGPDRVPAGAAQFGEPIWTGPADCVQLRSAGTVHGVRLHFVAAPAEFAEVDGPAERAGGAHSAQAFPLAQPILDAGPGQPPIIARGAWAGGHAPPRHLPEYGTVKLAFIHHSETPNGYGSGQVPSILRSIFVYHRYVRDYFDIGYNFAVDAFGRIWEARAGGIDEAVIGAHAGGYNTESTGMVVLGSFSAVAPPAAALNALARLLAWKLSLHGVPAQGRVAVEVSADGSLYSAYAPGAHVSLPHIAGHRDGDQTSCPGNALYARLAGIRPRVAAMAGAPAHLSIAAPVPAHAPGTSVTVSGRLTYVSGGAPLAAAPLEIQQIGPRGEETTIATLPTDTDGAWSYAAAPAVNTLLRALHRSAPTAVSDIVVLAVAPVLTLNLVSSAPLIVSGTVTPAGPRVTIDVYRAGAGTRALGRPVASKQVRAAGGSFQARIKRPPRGRYVLVARTPASARYAGAASPPVALTV